MKQKAVTFLGVLAIIGGIVFVRSTFDQTITTDAREEAAEQARDDLAEAAEITEEATSEEVAADPESGSGDGETAQAPETIAAYEEVAWAEEAPDVFRVKFETTAGPFVIESHEAWAPLGHERFYELCKIDFFDDTGFFRVVPGFVVQFGLAADPKLTAQYKSKTLQDDPVRKSNQRGKATFATSGANSRTTQLFINYGDNANLDDMGFAPFGEVVAGMENVESITSKYGEQPQQGKITREGTDYLRSRFPDLDFIEKVTLVEALGEAE